MILVAKEWVELLIGPLAVATLFGVTGALCLWRRPKRLGRWMIASAALVGYLGASPIVGNALLGPLERAYPPLRESDPMPAVGYVVVLGAGYTPHEGVPVTAALNQAGVVRLVEAIRLMRRFEIGKLVLSGGAPPGAGRSALGYAALARGLGVPESSLVILDESQTTAAEARAVQNILGNARFVLVTSAAHMPRAVQLMRRAGAFPIPAPTGQLVVDPAFTWKYVFPSAGGLREVEAALHEYLGLAALAVGFD
jgi:uncharacterized SAM-binding protein YcdF (DUF218 family)